jgi:hypothetical protein
MTAVFWTRNCTADPVFFRVLGRATAENAAFVGSTTLARGGDSRGESEPATGDQE